MSKILRKMSSLLLVGTLVFLMAPRSVSADVGTGSDGVSVAREYYIEDSERLVRNEKNLYSVRNRSVSAYESVSLTYNGKNIGTDALRINGTVYVSLGAFVEKITDMNVRYDSAKRTLYVNGQGLELSVSDGAYAVYANGRVLFCMTPSVVMSDGRMYTPISSVAKALGLGYRETASGHSLALSGSVTPLIHGSRYYAEDAVYWLSRIISAESRGETLLGQIAVGNIVLNRVRSRDFPNTIWGVIFDRKYGVQFSPTANGTIYNTPSSTAVTAAKICLDGFSLSEDILFFLEPRLSTSSWIPNTRKYVFSIEHHDFYA